MLAEELPAAVKAAASRGDLAQLPELQAQRVAVEQGFEEARGRWRLQKEAELEAANIGEAIREAPRPLPRSPRPLARAAAATTSGLTASTSSPRSAGGHGPWTILAVTSDYVRIERSGLGCQAPSIPRVHRFINTAANQSGDAKPALIARPARDHALGD